MNRSFCPAKSKISRIELIIAVLAIGFAVNQLGQAIEDEVGATPAEDGALPVAAVVEVK